ncbi:hypothetical protein BV898_16001 [Hypsibius exemplaris]|uniref:Thyroglobulin type-1 domain-containing protein n=1 Tax=Hypsibius exemplaris TaxID=2072580 RepID=A0A9X6NCG1_HYPEX|nr:hypothetical protein BV898_16001 [Hypsibius exemplaris]
MASSSAVAVVVAVAVLAVVQTVDGRNRLNPAINCSRMVQQAPHDTPWVPQCNDTTNEMLPLQTKKDGTKFCVDKYVASVVLDPIAPDASITCDCVAAAVELRRSSSKPLFVPDCDPATGLYLSKQCNRRKECWCSDPTGRQIGLKWGATVKLSMIPSVAAELEPHRAAIQSHPNCDALVKYFARAMERASA